MTDDDVAPATGRVVRPRSHLATDAPLLDLGGTWEFTLDRAGASEHGTIEVPGHWVLQGDGRWGHPWYTNVTYPIPMDAPHVPDDNPTGTHRRTFELPADWPTDGADRIRLLGAESEATVVLNGHEVGMTRGSRLTREFDVTGLLRPGSNEVVVVVRQWSPGTWLEDQDQWWLPGIFREVALLHRPAGGIEDVWLRADLDPATGHGTLVPELRGEPAWPVTLSVPEVGLEVTWPDAAAVGPVPLGPVEGWSAEDPRLYGATVHNAVEQVDLSVGFRRTEVIDGVWMHNGKPLKLAGMNRHETHPERGRTFDEAFVRADLALMKSFNVNAIRTAHYPPHPRLLDLCDELGFYVMLEADLETHGFEQVGWAGNPSGEPAWGPAILDRVERTVERDKNHPCIVSWSLGNESYTGANLAAAAAWVRERDPGRPVHYEGDHEADYTDIYSRMYPTTDEVDWVLNGTEGPVALADHPANRVDAARAARIRTMPYILCEYAHAMGTGPGGLPGYIDAMDHPRHAGGFIWEWRDHALWRTLPDGRRALSYGGDFGEDVHDGNFVCDGMITALGRPSAGLMAWANLVAPVRAALVGDTIVVSSRLAHADAAGLFLGWQAVGATEAATGTLPIPTLTPGATTTLALPELPAAAEVLTLAILDPATPGVEPREPREVHPHTGEPLLPGVGEQDADGRVLSVRQFPVPRRPGGGSPQPTASGIATAEVAGWTEIALLEEWVRALRPILWRAPTDNDRGRGRQSQVWEDAGMDRLVHRTVASAPGSLELRSGPAGGQAHVRTVLAWTPTEAGLLVRACIEPSPGWPDAIARIGLTVPLATAADVRWYGLGPTENYPDMLGGARLGTFAAADSGDLWSPEVRPQEAGHRGGLRRLELSTGGRRLTVTPEPDATNGWPGFSIAPWSERDIAASPHVEDLPPRTGSWLTLDARHSGLGTASCGPGIAPEHQVRPDAATLTFVVAVALGTSMED